jgi:peptidoglycan hydrolase CwlO-like protein
MGDTEITRRWLDKALLGAIAAIVALVGLVYGAITRGVDDIQKRQQDHDRRITVSEEHVKTLRDDVHEIKADVKSVLREVKK